MDFGTEDEVMGEDTEGSEEDNDTTDEETDEEQVGTWRRKVKGKGKAKMRELKPKKQAAPCDCRGKGVDTGDSMLGVKTGPSKSPIPLHTIAELEALLPQFSGEAYGIINKMNPDVDPKIEALKISDMPDMARYIELVLDRASRQDDILQKMDPVPSWAISKLEKRGQMLYFLFKQIENELMATKDIERETPSLMGSENVGDDGDVNMGVADETSE